MSLSIKSKPYKIPEYNLTGDLLSYLTCGLQYRYHSKGSLPPSTPVQLWFGEFIHGVMAESYFQWRNNDALKKFPWNWDPEIRSIELEIHRRLEARGLRPPQRLFCPYTADFDLPGLCPDENHPHKLIGSERTEAAINTWGKHLFPLISESEVKLKGIRKMPNYKENVSRCNYYGVTGIVDVLSSINLQDAPPGNLILHYLQQNEKIQENIDNLNSSEYEIIIDYKGMRRQPISNPENKTWQHHEWQILTYVFLRSQQPEHKPIVAGILFYLNELVPSQEDIEILQREIKNDMTDLKPHGTNLKVINKWKRGKTPPNLTGPYKEQRSIRIVPITPKTIQSSLKSFDNVVSKIEEAVQSEIQGKPISSCWSINPVERTCAACDFRNFCPQSSPKKYRPKVP